MDFKDYYSTLGVAKTATDKEIKQAYRKLARKHHPDVNPNDKGAESRFKDLSEAYEVLGDPAKRKKYDELGANWRAYEQAGAGGYGPQGPGSPFGSQGPQGGAWNVNFGGGGPGGSRVMTEEEMRDMFGNASNADPFSDFFHAFFGGAGAATADEGGGRRGRSSRPRAARQGRDVEHELELGLEDAFHGTTRRLQMTHDGQAKNVDVRIPAGVGDGSRVRVAGEGEHGVGGAKAGDLYLRVRLAPHSVFERKGRDLYTRVAVPLTTAVLGGEAEVATMAGKPLRLKIPPGTQSAQVFRLKGHGMPSVGKPDQTGDLYATIAVQLPRELTPEQKEHFEALQKLERRTSHEGTKK
jgi:curved DNA-binding protein